MQSEKKLKENKVWGKDQFSGRKKKLGRGRNLSLVVVEHDW